MRGGIVSAVSAAVSAVLAAVALMPYQAAAIELQIPILKDLFDGSMLSSSSSAAFDGSIVNCGSPDFVFQPDHITLSPDPPRRGEQLTVEVSGTLTEDVIVGSYADVTAKLGLIKLYGKRLDLCEESSNIGKECPYKEGPQTVRHVVDIPREIPPGKYSITVRAGTNAVNPDADKPLACMNIQFRMSLS